MFLFDPHSLPERVESPDVRPFYCESFTVSLPPLYRPLSLLKYIIRVDISLFIRILFPPSAQSVRTSSRIFHRFYPSQPASSAQRATVSFSISSPGRPSPPPHDLVTANGILTYTSEQPLNTLHPTYHSVSFSLLKTAFSCERPHRAVRRTKILS